MAFGSRRRDDRNNGKEFDNTNRGALFENDRKNGNPKAPDFKGSLNVDGKEYWLSGWEKESRKGPMLSLSIEPKQEQRRENYERGRQDPQAPARSYPRRDDEPPPFDDEPFDRR